MIQEARIASVKDLDIDRQKEKYGLRVLTMRHYPRGFSAANVDLWLPDAGPSKDLLEAYQERWIDWGEFEKRYREEQLAQERSRCIWYEDGVRRREEILPVSPMMWIRMREIQYGTITVMCWEDDPVKCHRHVLLDMLQSGMIGVQL